MDFFKKFGTDPKLEINGKWIELEPGLEFLIARGGNRTYTEALASLYEEHQADLEKGGPAADELADTIFIKAAASGLLKGWRGEVEYDGKPLEYSVENANLLLGLTDFRKWVMTHAANIENYRLAQVAETEKN